VGLDGPVPQSYNGELFSDVKQRKEGIRIKHGPGGLVGGVAAAAGEPTIGPCCATFGPRWPRQREVVVSAKAAVTWPWRPGIGTNEKSPPRLEPGGPGRTRRC
jgi:hypothetical protein